MDYLILVILFINFTVLIHGNSTPKNTITITAVQPLLSFNDKIRTIFWQPVQTGSTVVEVEPGYKIVVTVEECNLNGEEGDYVTISTDENAKNDGSLMFTYNVSGRPSYLYNETKLYINLVALNPGSLKLNFTKVVHERTFTTTEVPTTAIILPTPDKNVLNELTVYIEGRNSKEYKDKTIQKKFKLLLYRMASAYCKEQNFDLVYPVSLANIVISEILQCSPNWPGYHSCVEVRFSVPILIKKNTQSTWKGYQLTYDHLKLMWERYSKKYLQDGFKEYGPPDIDSWLNWQILIFSGVTLLFIICLLLTRHCSVKINNSTRKRKSDTFSIISSKKDSINDLCPHPLQETPPLFENIFPMYNPEKNPSFMPSFMEDNLKESSVLKKDESADCTSEKEDLDT